jgi:hypothetical protein
MYKLPKIDKLDALFAPSLQLVSGAKSSKLV